jgi:hypothetical protein
MKKSVIIFCCIVLFLPNAHSLGLGQSAGDNRFYFGAKGGLVSSVFAQDFQKMETTESRTGFSLGVFAGYQISDFIGLSVEALYVKEGTMHLDPNYIYFYNGISSSETYSQSITIQRVNSNIVLHNFEFPVLACFSLPKLGSLNAKLFAGGSFDLIYNAYAYNLLSVTSNNTNPSTSYVLSDRYYDNVTSSFAAYNLSGILGIGFEYGAYCVDIRYKLGFVPINNMATYNLQNQYKADFTSNALIISVGVNMIELFNK